MMGKDGWEMGKAVGKAMAIAMAMGNGDGMGMGMGRGKRGQGGSSPSFRERSETPRGRPCWAVLV